MIALDIQTDQSYVMMIKKHSARILNTILWCLLQQITYPKSPNNLLVKAFTYLAKQTLDPKPVRQETSEFWLLSYQFF